MMANYNKSLYWYGVRARLKNLFGKCLVFGGFIFVVLFFNLWMIGVGIIIFGFILMFKGDSQRFDYKRRSGYIVHQGDY